VLSPFLALWAGALEDGAPAQSTQSRPNIVIVMTDDQTVEQMQALKRVRTLLGRPGTTFTRNFATFPFCCPSRATYLTGQYSHNHRVRDNHPPEGGFSKLDSSNTVSVWLRDAGYATAHVGKYLNGYGRKAGVPAGWQEWYGSVGGMPTNYFDSCINENGRLIRYGRLATGCGSQQRPRVYNTDLYTRKAVDYINRRAPRAQPFFLSVGYNAPHAGGPDDASARCAGSAQPAPRHRKAFVDAPLPTPPGFNEEDVSDKPAFIQGLQPLTSGRIDRIRTDYQCRRESLLAVDEGVGAIVAALRSTGELDNTLFMFTSDNGFFQGEHRVPGRKVKVYEPSVRVPALMRGPGIPRGKHVDELTGNIDLAPTILDAANARPRRTLDGVSLLELARRPWLFASRELVLENGPDTGPGNPKYAAIRTDRYKYVEYVTGERELYDLSADPFEERSVHDSLDYSDVRRQLAERFRRLRVCAGASCR
jgi:N-acetylglucosamine-6-sulfatase